MLCALRPLALAAAAFSVLPANVSSAALVNNAAAHWVGTVDFGDCGSRICFTAHTDGKTDVCYDTVSAGNLTVTVQGCQASFVFDASRLVAGGKPICAAVGSADLSYTDFAGNTVSIPVTVVVSNGGIEIQGRFADVAGARVYSVHATGSAPCGVNVTRWSGTVTAVNY